ncbi:TPA: hypothetical protein ACGOTT_000507 [Streptococcus suis]
MKADVVFLLDGLTNKSGISGEKILESDLLNNDIEVSWYNYFPDSSDKNIVETIEVYPLFFGLPLKSNPGRPGFEYLLDGIDISKDNIFVLIRTEKFNNVIEELRELGINSRLSNYSRDGKTIIISANSTTKVALKNYLEKNKSSFIRLSHERYLEDNWYEDLHNITQHCEYRLLGYCEGGLLSAMKLCGVEICDADNILITNEPIGSYECQLITDTVIERLDSALKADKIPVIYLKHFAHDARNGMDKRTASEKVSKIIKDVIIKIKQEKFFNYGLVISDHNSEIGVDETLVGMTKIGIIGGGQLFNEYKDGSSQQELIDFISKKGIM